MGACQVALKPCGWAKAEDSLLKAYEGDTQMLENTRICVESKRSQLYASLVNGEVVGYVVLRIDSFMNGHNELVPVIAYGKYKGQPLCKLFMPIFEQIAKQYKCGGIRMHSARKGAERLYKKIGFSVSEVVFYKEI